MVENLKLKVKGRTTFPCGLEIVEETEYVGWSRVGGEINQGNVKNIEGCPIHGKGCSRSNLSLP
jgi:hypothetical protein